MNIYIFSYGGGPFFFGADNRLDKGELRRLISCCHKNRDGGVAEWSKAAVLKTVVPQGTVGSNPTSSARFYLDWYPGVNLITQQQGQATEN